MHHVGVFFDEHQIVHPNRSVFADSSQVVPSQIDEHQMLRTLLFVLDQFLLKPFFLFQVLASATGPGDRSVFKIPSLDLHQHLRRGSRHMQVAPFQVEHVGRGIDITQSSVDIERRSRKIGLKLLREDHLKNITGTNVFFGRFYCVTEG